MSTGKLIVCISLWIISTTILPADIINGDFSSGLTGWDHNDGVETSPYTWTPEAAYLLAPVDQSVYSSVLSQQFDVEGMDQLTFSFHLFTEDMNQETDHFYVSLLDSTYVSTLSDSVDPEAGIDPVPVEKSLVNYGDPASPFFFHRSSDFGEAPELAEGVTISDVDENDWFTISLLLPEGLDSATLRFELIHDYDPEDAITSVFIDNVALSSFSVVPVPGAVLLAGLGSVFVLFGRQKKAFRDSE